MVQSTWILSYPKVVKHQCGCFKVAHNPKVVTCMYLILQEYSQPSCSSTLLARALRLVKRRTNYTILAPGAGLVKQYKEDSKLKREHDPKHRYEKLLVT